MKRHFLTLVGALLFSVSVSTAQKPINVAFTGVVDESGYGGAVFKSQVSETLIAKLNATGVFKVREVEGKISVPPDAQTLAEIASELKVHAFAQAIVKRVFVQKPKRDPQVKVILEATLVPAKTPHLVFRACAEGKGNDPSEGKAVSKAVETAASEIATQLSKIVALRGQVLLPPAYSILPATHYKDRDQIYERTVRISLDMTSGMKVGAEVVILKKGNPVAKGKVVEVDIGSSLVSLTDVHPGTQIRSGDEVVVTFLPQRAERLPLPLQKEQEYKRVEHDFAWALAIAGAAIWAFAE